VELAKRGLLADTLQELPQMSFDALAFCSAALQYGHFGESNSEPTQCKIHEIRNEFTTYAHHMVAEVITPGGTKFRIDWRHGTRTMKSDNMMERYEFATGLDAYKTEGSGWTEECKAWCIQFEQDVNREAREFLKNCPFEYLMSAISGRDLFLKEEVCDQDCCHNIFELVTRGEDFAIDDKSVPYFNEFRRRSKRLQKICLN